MTGRIQFKEGVRSFIKWDLLKLRKMKLDKVGVFLKTWSVSKYLHPQVGEWSSSGGLNITNPEAFHEFGTKNITLKVTTIEVSFASSRPLV